MSPGLTPEEKTFLLNDAVYYEVLFALGVSNHDPFDGAVWEHLNFSRMGHARALLYFFECPSCKRMWKDDLVCADFGFPAKPLELAEEDRVRLNKDLFHLSSQRLRHTRESKPWPHALLHQVHDRTVLFIEHLLSPASGRDFTVNIDLWEALATRLKSGRELCVRRHSDRNGGDTGWLTWVGRPLPSEKNELTPLLCQ